MSSEPERVFYEMHIKLRDGNVRTLAAYYVPDSPVSIGPTQLVRNIVREGLWDGDGPYRIFIPPHAIEAIRYREIETVKDGA